MSFTTVTLAPSDSILTGSTPCAKCGNTIAHPELATVQNAHARIAELESQVKILTLRATSAVERATEYEVSLRRMASTKSTTSSSPPQPTAVEPSSSPAPAPAAAVTRLARYLSARTAAPELSRTSSAPPSTHQNPSSTQPHPPSTATASTAHPEAATLQAALEEETELRKAAEKQAQKTNNEIEELTAQLFEQANEMVAAERKARNKLELRVEVLEKRDSDKARRLGLLEMRVQRVERVRGLLSEGTG